MCSRARAYAVLTREEPSKLQPMVTGAHERAPRLVALIACSDDAFEVENWCRTPGCNSPRDATGVLRRLGWQPPPNFLIACTARLGFLASG